MTIYIDNDCKCHVQPGEGRTAAETAFFDGCCDAFIEGYRLVPAGSVWTRADGQIFEGEMAAPWKPWHELDAAQRAYEHTRYEAAIAAVDTLLLQMGGAV